MLVNNLLIIVLLLLASVSSILSQTLAELERKKNLNFTIYLDKSEYLIQEPIWVHYMIENNTNQPIPAYEPRHDKLSHPYIVNDKGDTISYEHLIPTASILFKDEPFLNPGESWYVCRNINYRLEPGNYAVQILYPIMSHRYRKFYNNESERNKWSSFREFSKKMHEISDVYSNTISFKVLSPESEVDKEAYDMQQEANVFWDDRNFEQYYEKLISIAEKYPTHPYSSQAYHVCRAHVAAKNGDDAVFKYMDMLIDNFTNTQYSYNVISIKTIGLTKKERDEYYNELKERFNGQWIVHFLDQLDKRYDYVEERDLRK